MSMTVTRRFGDIEVTVLTDGARNFDAELFVNADADRIASILAAGDETLIRTNFNAALIETGARTLLVDAGARDLFGPAAGDLPAALTEAGVDPEDIDTLFLTHLHPDHAAGTIDAEGNAMFPSAELVVMEAERAFWSDEANFVGADDMLRGWQQLARAVLSAYGDRLRPVSGTAEIVPGVTALPLPGHTPGHAGIRVASGDAQLVHVGDIVHAPMLQIPDPEISVIFDIDADTARAARKALLDEIATDGVACIGGHFLHPAFSRIRRDGAGYKLETL